MSLTFRSPVSGGAIAFWSAAALASLSLHVLLPAQILASAPEPAQKPVLETGATGAILFDLSDFVASPSEAGEDSAELAEAGEAPTGTESPEVVHAAKAADEPLLQQIPYEVEDDELKFGIASPDPVEETEEIAHETATEYDEEQVNAESQLGAVDQDASVQSVSGVDSEQTADKAQAAEEGLTAEELEQITEWQKSIVVRISKAKRYPKTARKQGIEGDVTVRFTIDRYGAILTREVAKTSGHPVLDDAALKVFDDLGKLPTPPSHLAGSEFNLMVPLRYSFK
jgi:protein TonB